MKTPFKTPLLISAVLVVLVLITGVLASCSKDDDKTTPKITAPVGKIAAKINGVSFEADGEAVVDNAGAGASEIIIGGDTDTETVSIFVTNTAKTGTYDIKGAQPGATPDIEINYGTDVVLFSSYFAAGGTKTGTLTITEIDATAKTISGTFSTTVLSNGSSKEITEGSFNKLPYISTAGSSLTAKIDGTAFTAISAEGELDEGVITLTGTRLPSGQIISIGFGADIAVGTYPLDPFSNGDIFAAYAVYPEDFFLANGTLTITKHDKSLKRVEGTFSFQAISFGSNNHTVTEGAFAVTYY